MALKFSKVGLWWVILIYPPTKRNKSDQDDDRNHDNRVTSVQDESNQSKKM
jgi:hypothetical protein